jgi:hypothetical protein
VSSSHHLRTDHNRGGGREDDGKRKIKPLPGLELRLLRRPAFGQFLYPSSHLEQEIFQTSWRMAASGMLRRVALVRTDVSEELSASSIRVSRIGERGTTLAVTSNRRTPFFIVTAMKTSSLTWLVVIICSPKFHCNFQQSNLYFRPQFMYKEEWQQVFCSYALASETHLVTWKRSSHWFLPCTAFVCN